ncbi:MAG TPA: hypothetical protein VM344_07190 [Vitreimonas sp.]|nr:hypothetical protein [Vitreimonas sp.]
MTDLDNGRVEEPDNQGRGPVSIGQANRDTIVPAGAPRDLWIAWRVNDLKESEPAAGFAFGRLDCCANLFGVDVI